MIPFVFTFWAPQFHFPWSGAVSQDIDPDFNWFTREIPPAAGNARIERSAFRLASYGTQLGLITEVLLEQLDRTGSAETPALARLRQLQRDIDAIKDEEHADEAHRHELVEAALVARVHEVRGDGKLQLAALAQRLLPLLEQGVPAGDAR